MLKYTDSAKAGFMDVCEYRKEKNSRCNSSCATPSCETAIWNLMKL